MSFITYEESRLNLDDIRYCGRSNEYSVLCEIADDVEKLEKHQVVFVSGDSGSGKTSLCRQLQKRNDESLSSRFYITGKFEEFNQQPYSAIKEAFGDLCHQIIECYHDDDDQFEKIRETLRDTLGSEDDILRKALPECQQLIGKDVKESSTNDFNETFAYSRLKLSFRALLKSSLCTGKTLVMCMDDLQWADQDSWDLIQYLIQDTSLTKFLFLGNFRTNEMSAWRRDIVSTLSEMSHVHVLPLKDFDFNQVNELVSAILKMAEDETSSLASIIHTKCGGNPYFSIQMIQVLEKKSLIRYSIMDFRWSWDTAAIRLNTDIGENLVDTFLLKINSLPSYTRKILTFASCLGGKFDAILLSDLFRSGHLSDFIQDMVIESIDQAIALALHEGILEKQKDSFIYRFVHDKIHQAFYTLFSEIEYPDKIHLALGRALLSVMEASETDDPSLTFLTVNQLNRCLKMITLEEDKVVIAKLNLAAARLAMLSSAFRPAAHFLMNGLTLLKKECEAHYKIRLDILIHLARAQLCLGRLPECHKSVNDVLNFARTTEEKLPVFQICIQAYGAECNLVTGLQVGLKLVEGLGVKVPKYFNKFITILTYLRAKKLMKGKTESVLLNYETATDQFKISAMKIIAILTTFAFQNDMMDAMATLVCMNTILTFTYGFVEESGRILTNFGLLMAYSGDFSGGCAIAKVGLKLSERTKSSIPSTFMLYYSGLNHLMNPLHSGLEPSLRGYRLGFEIGDTLNGFFCSVFYLEIFYFVGLPLSNLLKDLISFSQEMNDYNMQVTLNYLNVYHQSVLNLTYEFIPEDPTKLDGIAMTENSILSCGIQKVLVNFWFGKLVLATYFQNIEVTRECLDFLSFGRPDGADGCMFWVTTLLWCEGLGAIQLARLTRKRKYFVLARKRLRELKSWMRKGSVNCYHSLLHLEAEFAILNSRPFQEVKDKFDSAIAAARRMGWNNAAALASERAALYFRDIHDQDRASMYMITSHELYECWGATSKSLAMTRDYPNLLSERFTRDGRLRISQTMGTSHLGRVRHTSLERSLHSGELSDDF